MPTLRDQGSSLLVSSDCTGGDAWQHLRSQALAENGEGFRAYTEAVFDPGFDHASWIEVKAAIPAASDEAEVMFVADSTTLTSPPDLARHPGPACAAHVCSRGRHAWQPCAARAFSTPFHRAPAIIQLCRTDIRRFFSPAGCHQRPAAITGVRDC
jgi:hypothetical protein